MYFLIYQDTYICQTKDPFKYLSVYNENLLQICYIFFTSMYFVLLSFVINPVVIAASISCVTTSWVALTDLPNTINKSSAYAT